jgi:hypothetical protein
MEIIKKIIIAVYLEFSVVSVFAYVRRSNIKWMDEWYEKGYDIGQNIRNFSFPMTKSKSSD